MKPLSLEIKLAKVEKDHVNFLILAISTNKIKCYEEEAVILFVYKIKAKYLY